MAAVLIRYLINGIRSPVAGHLAGVGTKTEEAVINLVNNHEQTAEGMCWSHKIKFMRNPFWIKENYFNKCVNVNLVSLFSIAIVVA